MDRVEDEQLTVTQLRQALLADQAQPADGQPPGTVADLKRLIARGVKFATVYADPPWRYDNQETSARTDRHYPTMTVDAIAALPVADLAADAAHLHLWATSALLPDAFTIIEAWGFAYKSMSRRRPPPPCSTLGRWATSGRKRPVPTTPPRCRRSSACCPGDTGPPGR
jgi:hypothetical protein